MATIGDRVHSSRLRLALSQAELSERTKVVDGTGVTIAAISRIENDRDKMRRHPNMATIRKLAAALDVDPGWLLTGEGDPHQPASATA